MGLIALLAFSFWIAVRIVFPRFARDTNITDLFVMLLTFHRTAGPRPQIPVRDLRVRESGRGEHSVRLVGQLIGANVNVGDDVTLSGFSRGGIINVHRGINHRTRSVIRVRA
jgi:hypothetical protein